MLLTTPNILDMGSLTGIISCLPVVACSDLLEVWMSRAPVLHVSKTHVRFRVLVMRTRFHAVAV